MSTTGIYKNQVTTTQTLLLTDFGLFCKVKIFVGGRFQGSYYCSNLKFGMRTCL